MGEFRGIYPAIITPMRRDGEIDEAAFREVMEYNIRAGVHGFWVAGGTGESILLTEDENGRIAEAAADQNRGRVKNIMHVGAATTAQTIRQAERAARAGVEAICAVPPFFYNGSEDDVVEYYRAVGAATGLPLFIYNLPSATGVEITTDLADKIQERVPQLAGLKHSALNFGNIVHFVNMGLDCFTGSGMLMVSALSLGAAGTVDGPPCAAPEPWVEAWDAYHAGDVRAAEAAQGRASEMYPPLLKAGYLPAIKALVGERLGIDCGSPRPPASQVTPEILEVARAEARRLGPVQVTVG